MKAIITFKDNNEMRKFLERCVYIKVGRFDSIPRFLKIEAWPNFLQVILNITEEQKGSYLKELLDENKVKYNWINIPSENEAD